MSSNRQLDLFVALIGDVPFRDEREAMSAPLVCLLYTSDAADE